MAQRGGFNFGEQKAKITAIVMALAAPVLITFLLYLASSAAGASTPAAVGYTITGVGNATNATTGISCIWIGSATGPCGGGLAAPTFLVSVFNGIILLVVFLVVIVLGIGLAGAALEGHQD